MKPNDLSAGASAIRDVMSVVVGAAIGGKFECTMEELTIAISEVEKGGLG
jgi:hypothetical protein